MKVRSIVPLLAAMALLSAFAKQNTFPSLELLLIDHAVASSQMVQVPPAPSSKASVSSESVATVSPSETQGTMFTGLQSFVKHSFTRWMQAWKGAASAFDFAASLLGANELSATTSSASYAIYASTGVGGTISPSGNITVKSGTDQGFTITPYPGYKIDNVIVDGKYQGARAFFEYVRVSAHHTIYATFAPQTYTITHSTSANGTIYPSGKIVVKGGSDQTLTITPDPGYIVSYVAVDGASVGPTTSYTFSNVSANHTVSAIFVGQTVSTYTITASAGAGGGISPSGAVSINSQGNKTFTITPDPGYMVSYVTVDGLYQGPITSYTFSNVSADHTISATFAQQTYAIVTSAGANGTISPSGVTDVNGLGSQTITITPDPGYIIAYVYIDGVSQGPITSYTFSRISANHTIDTTFARCLSITASAGANGTISPSGVACVNSQGSQTFTLSPNAGYQVADVKVDGVSKGAITSYTFSSVSANHTISATFAQQTYTITASADTLGGTISPNGAVSVNSQGSQTFTLSPNAGYQVTDVKVDGISVGARTSYTFSNVSAKHTISATFAQQTYTITAAAGENGTISPNGAVSVNSQGSRTFTITPNAGYAATVIVDGVSQGAKTSYTFSNVSGDRTISATFVEQTVATYTITASAGKNGSISPSGTTTVENGNSQTFTITPDPDCTIANVKVDGISKGAITSYTFSDVSANHTISPVFERNYFIINASAGENGTISPSGDVKKISGIYPLTFTITPDPGYQIEDVVVGGVSVGPMPSYSFWGNKDSTISATFSAPSVITGISPTSGNPLGLPIRLPTTVTITGERFGKTPKQIIFASGDTRHSTTVGKPWSKYWNDNSITLSQLPYDSSGRTTVLAGTYAVSVVGDDAVQSNSVDFTIYYTFSVGADKKFGSISTDGIITNGKINISEPNKTFTFTPNPGYQVKDVKVDEISKGPITSYTFSNIHNDHSIRATFAQASYTIRASAGVGGAISPSGAVTLVGAWLKTFTIKPNSGYLIEDVKVDGVSQGPITNYTFQPLSGDRTISATFVPKETTCTITASAGAGGAIAPSGAVSVNNQGSQTFTLSPNAGYQVADVRVDGVSQGAITSYTFSRVSSNHTISATFSAPSVITGISPTSGNPLHLPTTVTITGERFGKTPKQIIFASGDTRHSTTVWKPWSKYWNNNSITLSQLPYDPSGRPIIPAGTYSVYLVGDDAVQSNSVDFTIYYTFSVGTDKNGTISSDGTANNGTINISEPNKTFTFTPNPGYQVKDVKIDGKSKGAITSYTFSNINNNHFIGATFAKASYTIRASAGVGGAISPSGAVTLVGPWVKTFTIKPNPGYQIEDVKVDGVSQGPITNYTFQPLSSDRTISATFAQQTYSITAAANANGSISPDGTISVGGGKNQTFTITPDPGYQIEDVIVDGVSKGAKTSYTFSNVIGNHTINASFKVQTGWITTWASAGGVISPNGRITVEGGKDQTFTITPDPGYAATVIVDGISKGALTSYTFSNISGSHDISVSFNHITYWLVASAGLGGSISPGSVKVQYGSQQYFSILPSKNYRVANVIVDGVSKGAITSYTFSNISADHTISATFSKR